MSFKSILLSICLASSLVQAAPASANPDDMDSFLQSKGFVGQLSNATQALGDKVSDKASELVVSAMGFLGVPYKRGGNSFETGLDCSGFVRVLYEQTLGLLLPRKAEQQAAATATIDKAELQPGDLVFFNTMRRAFSHVGIYVGDNKFIHSPKPGAAVRVEDLRTGYWEKRFDGARRVLADQAGTAPQIGSPVLPPSLQAAAPDISRR